jgi:hypothetical protein
MKQSIFILFSICFLSCKNSYVGQPVSVAITIITDPTDQRVIQPNADFTLALYDLESDKSKQVFFRLTSTTDMVINPSREVHMLSQDAEAKDNTNDDPYIRERHVLSFYEQVKQAIKVSNHLQKDTGVYRYSECFRSICREITLLQKKKFTQSILLVYSDLQENSDIVTVYGSSTIDTAMIRKRLLKTKMLPNDLKGLTVYFIFQPRDRNEDKKFMAMYGLYQKLLEERHAVVVLQSNNNN